MTGEPKKLIAFTVFQIMEINRGYGYNLIRNLTSNTRINFLRKRPNQTYVLLDELRDDLSQKLVEFGVIWQDGLKDN